MRNPNYKKIIKIIWDESKTHFKFRREKCGLVWYPSIIPGSGGRLYWGSWQCPNSCRAKVS